MTKLSDKLPFLLRNFSRRNFIVIVVVEGVKTAKLTTVMCTEGTQLSDGKLSGFSCPGMLKKCRDSWIKAPAPGQCAGDKHPVGKTVVGQLGLWPLGKLSLEGKAPQSARATPESLTPRSHFP